MKGLKRLSLIVMLSSMGVAGAAEPHWSYEGKAGPEHWSELSSDFHLCHEGKAQSPINIKDPIQGNLQPLNLAYQASAEKVINNGHTIQVTVDNEDDFVLDGEKFTLRQYHFHTPGENQINGHTFPLEAHFVHSQEGGDLAVVAVMFEVGKENPALAPLIDAMPKKENQQVSINREIDLRALFPQDLHYYRFSGSLTTPPCSEGIRWLVMKQPVTLSQAQLDAFRQALKTTNNRPLQPLNGRMIVE
ncbi:carbonic anhydrase [Pantoea deleyi]|uniref:carbonic anhydrase n=1 Tax=Pantoea deleyi TaxID=470932 RepID=A0A506Q050_9GAMM|nr:carbonic anhydrase family protein [Pantoea deleyi]ORM79291.1 carbonic anhydrase [Pantoea deleyi]TPV39099.1 carbonic anhydrase family protein [Pantoea deleyi]